MASSPTSGEPSSIAAQQSSSTVSASAVSASSNAAILSTSTAAAGQITTTSATSSLPSVTSTPVSSTSSRDSQNAKNSHSTTTPQSSVLPQSSPTSQPSGLSSSNNRLSNGAVAGIVIGVALGLALLTFLVTFVTMRRQQHAKGKRGSKSSKDNRSFAMSPPRHQDSRTVPKKPLPLEPPGASGTYEDYLPQSADDNTIKQRAKSVLDHIELHVENFYRNSSSSALRADNAELAIFDSPYLPVSLSSLLPRSKSRPNIMKHALAHSVTSSISPSASPTRSLLPAEYTLSPNHITSTRSTKAGFTEILSRWRVMTAYLRLDPTKDASYIAQRDKQISDTAQSFAKAFAPWKSTEYMDEERARNLSAILEEAANLGIFLFSQPSTLRFHWPAPGELRSGSITVLPALLKTTNEKGRNLEEVQVMLDQVVLDG